MVDWKTNCKPPFSLWSPPLLRPYALASGLFLRKAPGPPFLPLRALGRRREKMVRFAFLPIGNRAGGWSALCQGRRLTGRFAIMIIVWFRLFKEKTVMIILASSYRAHLVHTMSAFVKCFLFPSFMKKNRPKRMIILVLNWRILKELKCPFLQERRRLFFNIYILSIKRPYLYL